MNLLVMEHANDKRLAQGQSKFKLVAITTLICIWMGIWTSVLSAAPAMLNNGHEIDISPEQLPGIKNSPGIFFFSYQPEDIFKHKIKEWIIIKLSPALGGGFLAGTTEHMDQALSLAGISPDLVGTVNTISASSPKNKQEKKQPRKPIEVEVGYAYRQDSLEWNIAGDMQGNNPNILSELTWENLRIHELHIRVRADLKWSIILKGSMGYGMIVDGDNQDSDFAADNREMEFSRSNNDADQGNTLDGLIGIGFRIQPFNESFSIIPLGGYSYCRQQLSLTNGKQTLSRLGGPPLGSFEGLDSTYDAEWRGPWIGFETTLHTQRFLKRLPPLSLYLGMEYHWADYYAKADWNLRDDFMHPKSFEHEADGTGTLINLGVRMRINPWWSVTLGYETETWSAESGVDRVFLANGTTVTTRLNEVNWASENYQVGCSIHF